MDISIYKIIHLVGLMTLFFAFGGLTLGARAVGGRNFPFRRTYTLLHGIGLLLLIISGFGMLAKLGLTGEIPHWAIAKIAIWLLLGLMLTPVLRLPGLNRYFWLVILVLGVSAAWLGIYK
jgi:hypothetical protein